jgi:DNA-binding FadR family transcriptional regulator
MSREVSGKPADKFAFHAAIIAALKARDEGTAQSAPLSGKSLA